MTDPGQEIQGDILVVGSGAAGLSAALAAGGGVEAVRGIPAGGSPEPRILLATRGRLGHDGASPMAQGGVAAALHSDDSAELHALDTVLAGAGLSRDDRVEILTSEGPERVRELIGLGARFDRDASGSLALAMEGAHSRRRVIHAQGDQTGAEVTSVLARAVRQLDAIRVLEQVEVTDLHSRDGRIGGAVASHPDGTAFSIRVGAVILATGGPCHLYRRTTTPPSSIGGGLAMAIRAGARTEDMEFVQFHPTALAVDADPLPLVTEALRGEGATLVDRSGQRLEFPDDRGELSPRDQVARTLWSLLRDGRPVFLDARRAPGALFPDRFPGVFELCRQHGIDPRAELVPVTPAAHYHMGGIRVDEEGRSTLPGLWAAGEVASTGVHGANRLASNSLLEGLVFGARAGASARQRVRRITGNAPLGEGAARPAHPDPVHPALDELRTLLWERVGVIRDEEGLGTALSEIDRMDSEHRDETGPAARRLRDALLVARQITASARARRESRGSHYRSDYPTPRAPTPS